MRSDVKKVIGIFGAWITTAGILLIILPSDLRRMALIPLWFIVIAIISSCIIIILREIIPSRPTIARIDGREYKACMFCPMNRITDNPVNKNYLIYKCSAKDMRTIYVPGKVPGWCPYVVS